MSNSHSYSVAEQEWIFTASFFFNKHLLNDFCGSGIAFNVGDKASGNSAVVPCRGRRKVRAPLNTLYTIKYEKSHRKTPNLTHMGSEEVLSEAEP